MTPATPLERAETALSEGVWTMWKKVVQVGRTNVFPLKLQAVECCPSAGEKKDKPRVQTLKTDNRNSPLRRASGDAVQAGYILYVSETGYGNLSKA